MQLVRSDELELLLHRSSLHEALQAASRVRRVKELVDIVKNDTGHGACAVKKD